MIVSTCGYGYTGASAVLDFLRGYNSIQILDNVEFQMLHQADGILDLKYHLVYSRERIACNAAIARFIRLQKRGVMAARMRRLMGDAFDQITKEYIDSLIKVAWMGKSNYDPLDVGSISKNRAINFTNRVANYACRKLKINAHFPRYKTRYFSILTENEFDTITKEYLGKIMKAVGVDSSTDVVLDMLFSATNPSSGTEFFDDAKTIIVDRDPRDIFIVSHRSDEEYSFMPWDSSDHFITYYKTLRENTVLSDKTLLIRYEDLIYDYWTTTEKIMNFLGYQYRPENEFKYFNPDISVKYTNLNCHKQHLKDIELIEEKLTKYLYAFTPYTPVQEQNKNVSCLTNG